MLRLKAQRRAVAIDTSNTVDVALEEIARVKLESGLGRKYFEDAPRLRLLNARGNGAQFPRVVQYEVVIVAFG